jgi:hypothetical protein
VGPGPAWQPCGSGPGQNRNMARELTSGEAVDDGSDDLGSPRTIGEYRSTQDAMRKLLVLAPLPKGHRNMAVGEVKRRRSRAYGVVMMGWSELIGSRAPAERVAHHEHRALDGEACGGPNRRRGRWPASEKMAR